MEEVERRSESPILRSKGNSHSISENGNNVIEGKTRKRKFRNRNKHQINGNDAEGADADDQRLCDEQITSSEIDNNTDSNHTDHEDETASVNNCENGNVQNEANEFNDHKSNDGVTITYEISEEVLTSDVDDQQKADGNRQESEENAEEELNVDEISSEENSNMSKVETESCAKKDITESQDSLPEGANQISEDVYDQDTNNDIVEPETNGVTQEEEPPEECPEVCQTEINGSSEVSISCEEVKKAEDNIQASPDTVTKDDLSIPSKISNFFGKFAYSTEQKQDSDISSSKKAENTALNHPYLSKISGRRGIKDRLNSSATLFNTTGSEARTPENSGISLDDSFRVRTNPPRLNSMELNENPTLRKFKGKRCLNAGEGPEEEDDFYLSTIKRRKLDEKSSESGILGSIFWSPFKKRALDTENQLKLTTESKLSRLLSPFWFWKKATEGQTGK